MSIERNFHKYLFNLVKSNANHNKVAKTVALNYQRLNRDAKDKFFESLMAAYSNFTDSAFDNIKFDTSRLESAIMKKDFRLKAVRLANVRGIPEQKNSIKFGFDLFEQGQIQNAVFLGPNGTGKSSLFSAIEFIYSHEVAEKKLRTSNPESLTEKEFIEYLEHFGESPICEIETPSGNFSLRNRVFKTEEELKTIYPDTHFISDYDIYKKGQLNYLGEKKGDSESFHLLIASSLGLQDYLDFTNLLKSISNYRRTKESTERNKLSTNKITLTSEHERNKEQIHAKTERIKELNKNNSGSIKNDNREKLAGIIAVIKLNSYSLKFDKTQFQETFETYRNAHEIFLGLSVNRNLQTEAQFLSLGLDLINQSENCPFCENSKSSISEIRKRIESRILEIKEFETASKNLEQGIRNVQSKIKDTLTTYQLIERTLKSEIDKITAVSEFIDIHQDEKNLIDLITSNISVLMDIDEKISKIISSNDILSKKDEAVFRLIKENETILLVDIVNTPIAIDAFVGRRQQKILAIEKSLTTAENTITPAQQILILESEIKNHQSSILSIEQQVRSLESEIGRLTKIMDTITDIKLQAGEFAKILSVAVNKLVANSFVPIKETIEEILSDYLKEESVSLQIRLDEKVSDDDPDSTVTTIVAEIQRTNTQTGKIEIYSPSKYFNTFRFRLFCTMVNISVVIAARKNSGINLPIVLDDVFYASDYSSKITFRQFITTVLNIFKKFNSEMPLQFILFTHDELVFDSALDAIAEFDVSEAITGNEHQESSEWKIPIQNRTVFARLFSAKEVESVATESQFGKYWDLAYKIPTQLEQILKTN